MKNFYLFVTIIGTSKHNVIFHPRQMTYVKLQFFKCFFTSTNLMKSVTEAIFCLLTNKTCLKLQLTIFLKQKDLIKCILDEVQTVLLGETRCIL